MCCNERAATAGRQDSRNAEHRSQAGNTAQGHLQEKYWGPQRQFPQSPVELLKKKKKKDYPKFILCNKRIHVLKHTEEMFASAEEITCSNIVSYRK